MVMSKKPAISNVPKMTREWKFQSSSLHLDFKDRSSSRPPQLAPIGGLPLHVQESVIVEELLWALQGFSRSYIYALPLNSPEDRQEFAIHESLDSSLRHPVKDILQCSTLFSTIAR